MKKKGNRFAAFVLLASLCLSGCKSIILDADLDKATVEMVTVPAGTETVPDYSLLEADEAMATEKYAISGQDAFYILPAHRPAPDNILDFQILDLTDGTTTIYAYQAMYQSEDTSGLGGAPEEGSAADTQNAVGTAITDTEEMATILMAFNMETKQYRVFFHQVLPLDKSVVKTWDENSESTDSFAVEDQISSSQEQEKGSFFAHRLEGGDRYFFYLNGVGYVFNGQGEILYQKDINDLLDYKISQYGGEGAAITISNVVMDTNYFMYVTMNIEKKDAEITEDTEESDLEDEDSGVTQMLYYCIEYNIGEPESPSEEEERYFISRNANYDNQVQEWMEADGGSFDLGEMDGEPDMDDIHDAVPSAESIQEDIPDQFETYRFSEPDLNMELYFFCPFYKNDWFWQHGWFLKILENGTISPYIGYGVLYGAFPSNMADSFYVDREDKGYVVMYRDSAGRTNYCLVDYDRYPEAQTSNVRQFSRTYEVVWHEKEDTSEGENSSADSSTHSMTIQEIGYFTESYEIRFRGDTYITWSEDIYSSDMIARSPGSGVLRYGTENTEEDEEKQTSFFRWMLANSGGFSASGVQGAAQNAVLYISGQQAFLVAVTTAGLTIYQSPEGGGSLGGDGYFVPASQINFGAAIDSGGVDELNQINLPESDTDSSGTDQMLSVSAMAGIDLYTGNTLLIRKENGNNYLYLAGVDNGLIKYNISAEEGSLGQGGQLSPYPYYAIWEGPQGADYLYGIGFQSSEYAYSETDICCAKLYRIPLHDADAASNLVVSALNQDNELKTQVLSGGTDAIQTWNTMLSHLGIGDSDLSKVNLYREFLLEGDLKKENAVLRFYELAALPPSRRTEVVREQILACRYPEELEDLILELNGDSLEEEWRRLSRIMENAGLTQEEWTAELNDIAFRLQIPETYDAFIRQKAVEQFAQMASVSLRTGMEARVSACETIQDLEYLMSEYHLDSITIYRLSQKSAGDGEETSGVSQEELEEAQKKREEVIRDCRQSYMENGYREENGTRTYWKDVYGSAWNQQWENLWNGQLEDILEVFQQSEG